VEITGGVISRTGIKVPKVVGVVDGDVTVECTGVDPIAAGLHPMNITENHNPKNVIFGKKTLLFIG